MKKEQVRQLFPEACRLAGEVRAVFGDDVKLVYLQEGERELGKPGDSGVNPGGHGNEFVRKGARANEQ